MHIERDVMVTTRDGTLIAIDIFKPDGAQKVPVITSMSPYGKDVHWPTRFPLYEEADQSDDAVWETPTPQWWTDRGFAVVRADTRGTGKSSGRLDLFAPEDAEDYYDVIEWCGTQPWSTGKVASSGVSWYAMMGWRAAALQPPHLAALIAWEGCTDYYREAARQGGIYANASIRSWWDSQIVPQRHPGDHADLLEDLQGREFLDEWYEQKMVDLDKVTVPVLSAGNWGSIHMHLRGNVEGYMRAASQEKWLIIHSGSHIGPYYTEWGKQLQLDFLDRFLKGNDSAMDGIGPVRLAVRRGHDIEWRDQSAWPAEATDWRNLYLDAGLRLDWSAPAAEQTSMPATFDLRPDERLEITGPVAVNLWVTSEVEDFDVFIRLEQYDADGTRIAALGPQGALTPVPMGMGWLRASHREIDHAKSQPYRPWHNHVSALPVVPGEPTLLQIEIWPTSITIEPGQTLQLQVLAADDDLHPRMAHNDPTDRKIADGVTILTGGSHASHVVVPVVPSN